MTVKELMEILKTCAPDREVCFDDIEYGASSITFVQPEFYEYLGMDEHSDKAVVLLTGSDTCPTKLRWDDL